MLEFQYIIRGLFLQKVPNSNLHLYAFLPEYHLILPTVPPPQACTGRKQPRTYKTFPQATCYLSRMGEQTSKLLPYQYTSGVFGQSIESEKTKDIQRRNQRHRTPELKSKLVFFIEIVIKR